MENNGKKKHSFWKIAMYVYIIGVIVTVLIAPVPRFSKHGHSRISRDKTCYSNIRVIQGAVEMYNMDHETMISSLSDSETLKPTILKGYLRPVTHHEPMCYYKGLDLEKGDVGIYCEYHGDIDGSLGIKGSYQKTSIFNINLDNFMNECQYQFPYALVWHILWPFVIYMSFFSR